MTMARTTTTTDTINTEHAAMLILPRGLDGTTAAALAAAGYRAAFLYEGGPLKVPPADPYRIVRIPIGSDTDLATELRAA